MKCCDALIIIIDIHNGAVIIILNIFCLAVTFVFGVFPIVGPNYKSRLIALRLLPLMTRPGDRVYSEFKYLDTIFGKQNA